MQHLKSGFLRVCHEPSEHLWLSSTANLFCNLVHKGEYFADCQYTSSATSLGLVSKLLVLYDRKLSDAASFIVASDRCYIIQLSSQFSRMMLDSSVTLILKDSLSAFKLTRCRR